MKKQIPVNEYGCRIGESHHNATISDATVNEIRDMHEGPEKWSYGKLARHFNLPKGTIQKICTYARRGQVPQGFRTIDTGEDGSTSGAGASGSS